LRGSSAGTGATGSLRSTEGAASIAGRATELGAFSDIMSEGAVNGNSSVTPEVLVDLGFALDAAVRARGRATFFLVFALSALLLFGDFSMLGKMLFFRDMKRSLRAIAVVDSRFKFASEERHLALQKRRRSVVANYVVGKFGFPYQGQLLGDTRLGLRSGNSALFQPNKLLLRSTGHAEGEIKPIFQSFLKQEWDFDHPIPTRSRGQRFPPDLKQSRVQERFQPLPFSVI